MTARVAAAFLIAAFLASSPARPAAKRPPITLAIDVGGSHIKDTRIQHGRMLDEWRKIETPSKLGPGRLVKIIQAIAMGRDFDRVSVGFPGPVRRGVVFGAPNLSRVAWRNGGQGQDLQGELQRALGKPVRVANDAATAALAHARLSLGGRRILVLTLGTGFGSALLQDGAVTPMELGHHEAARGRTYEELLSRKQLEAKGKKVWNRRLAEALEQLRRTYDPDLILLGGGNAKQVFPKLLGPDVRVIDNQAGVSGGPHLFERRNRNL